MIQHVLLGGYGRSGNRIVTRGLGAGLRTGYNLYRGAGDSIAGVDFSSPVASGLIGEAAAVVGLGHAPSTRYLYVLRPMREGLEMPNITARCVFETDSAGQWVGKRPGPVESVSARILAGGQVRLSWSYRTADGATPATQFALYWRTGPGIVPGTPQAAAQFEGDGPYVSTFTLPVRPLGPQGHQLGAQTGQ